MENIYKKLTGPRKSDNLINKIIKMTKCIKNKFWFLISFGQQVYVPRDGAATYKYFVCRSSIIFTLRSW